MLDMIRKKQKSLIIQFVFWAIIAAFVGTIFLVWGKGDYGGTDNQMAVTVNDTRIDLSTFQRVHQNLTDFYRQVYGKQFTPELEKRLKINHQAFRTVVDQALLLEEGKRLDIRISPKELIQSIASIEAFQRDGKFDRERYVRLLAHQRATPEQFEKSREEQMIVEKVRQKLNEGVTVSDQEVEELYRQQEEKVELDFLRFTPSQFESEVAIDENALAAFYAEKSSAFRIPEKISLSYVELNPAAYQNQVVVTPQDVEKYYRRRIDLFEIEEKVKVAHILFRIPPDSDQAARDGIRAKAQEVLEKIKAGEDFGQLAKRVSDDTASIAKEGELGYFSRGAMPQSLEQAAFSLPAGGISDLLLSQAGYHILKILEHIEPGVKPLEAVKEQLETLLKKEKSKELAYEKAMDAYNINRKEGNLDSAAKSLGLEIQATPLFARGESAGKLDLPPEIVERAFTLEQGKLARPVALSDQVVLFAVKERQASRTPNLSEVKPAVEKTFREQKAAEITRQAAEGMLADLRQGKTLADSARQRQMEVSNTGLFSRRSSPFIPRIGNVGDAFPLVFQLTAEKPLLDQVVTVEDDVVLMVLTQLQPADVGKLTSEQRNSLHDVALSRKQQENMAQKLTELSDKAKITMGPVLQKILEES